MYHPHDLPQADPDDPQPRFSPLNRTPVLPVALPFIAGAAIWCAIVLLAVIVGRL